MQRHVAIATQKGPISCKLLNFRGLSRPIRDVCKRKIQNYDKKFFVTRREELVDETRGSQMVPDIFFDSRYFGQTPR
jgi:hypothetical protein